MVGIQSGESNLRVHNVDLAGKMFDLALWKVTLLFFLYYANVQVKSDVKCDLRSIRSLNLTVNSRRDEKGEWITSFSARRESNGTSRDINVDVNHSFMDCEGRHTVHIQGVMRESSSTLPLLFHPKCGKNARIINNGRTVEKIDVSDGYNAVAITDRPLGIEELFEVRLDKKAGKFSDAIGIGVTTQSPHVIEIPRHMNSLNSGTWLMYLNNFYRNGSLTKSNYMKNLKEVKVGERVGVKRTRSGNLHLYINGDDQGVAASDVPSEVYGVFELYQDATMGTIIEH